MKKTPIFILLIALVFGACSKSDSDVVIPNTPRSEVPNAMVGQWLNGVFSMSEWWSYDGTQYEGNPYERSVAFDLSKNGDAEFYLAIATFDGLCRTEAFTYEKGTVKFDEVNHSFTLYPQQGNFRGLYSCLPSSNFDRAASADELHSTTYYYSFETVGGHDYMVIRFSPDLSEAGSYFQATTW